MPPGPTFLPEAGGANGSKYAMHTSGSSGFMFAGIGFDLNNADSAPESMQSKPYDASAWTGVSFMVKGNAKIRLELPQSELVPTDRGGSCTGTCWDVHGFVLTTTLSSNWQEVKVPFSSLVRQNGAATPVFNAKQVMSISFKHQGDAFDFWIDDVRFYK